MLFDRSYIKKAISALLLVMLLLIHSIKLLHSHSGNNSFSYHTCGKSDLDKNNTSAVAKSSTDCSICSYQLNKDADDLVYSLLSNYKPEPKNSNTQLISFHRSSPLSAFENRGPPSVFLVFLRRIILF